ncbi:hypothetical protein CDEF62S_00613 [Castellaniella defragrans]
MNALVGGKAKSNFALCRCILTGSDNGRRQNPGDLAGALSR